MSIFSTSWLVVTVLWYSLNEHLYVFSMAGKICIMTGWATVHYLNSIIDKYYHLRWSVWLLQSNWCLYISPCIQCILHKDCICVYIGYVVCMVMVCMFGEWQTHVRVTAEKTFTDFLFHCILLFWVFFVSVWDGTGSRQWNCVFLCSDLCAKGTLCSSGTTEQKHVIMVDSRHSSQPNNIVITSSCRETNKSAVNQSTEK